MGRLALVLWLAVSPAGVLWAAALSVTVRDSAGSPVPDAVVYLLGPGLKPRPPTDPVVIDQVNKNFLPAVTVIQAGTAVRFPNSDSVSHHVYSFARPNSFELPLYKGQGGPALRFDHAGVITLGCNIHDSMVGWILVVDTPLFGTTDESGKLVLTEVPNGAYEAMVWSPRLDPARSIAAGKLPAGTEDRSASLQVARKLRAVATAGALAGGDY